jgi:uncharacterized protein
VTDLLMMMPWMVLLGLITGLFAGLLGIGGGLVMVPVLHSLLRSYGVDPDVTLHIAIATAVAVIIPTGCMSARTHAAKGGLDRDIFRQMAPGTFVGVIVGIFVAGHLPTHGLQAVFAGTTLLMAFIMLLDPQRFKINDHMPPVWVNRIMAAIFGAIASVMGVAGGIMNTPYMSLHGVPIHRAVGTSAALGVVIAVPATVGYMIVGYGHSGLPPASVGYVNIGLAAAILPFSMLMAPYGARLAHKMPVVRLRQAFAVFLIIVAIKMGWGLFG